MRQSKALPPCPYFPYTYHEKNVFIPKKDVDGPETLCYGIPILNEEDIGSAVIQHWFTKTKKTVLLKKVDEDDCEFRFPDGNDELSHDWNVLSFDLVGEDLMTSDEARARWDRNLTEGKRLLDTGDESLQKLAAEYMCVASEWQDIQIALYGLETGRS